MKAIIISGAGSHSGKTTIACGLLAALKKRALKICAYKTGPDYIDTEYLRRAGNCETYNLDTWLMNSEKTRELFLQTSAGKDFAIIEGAMALFDGNTNSTAEIAKLFGLPVVLVINAKSIGESAAAIALGFREYDPYINLAGVILNNIASDYHEKIISDALKKIHVKFLGAFPRNDTLAIPERHLGLMSAFENGGPNLEALRCEIENHICVDEILKLSKNFERSSPPLPPLKGGTKKIIAVARDEAFTFYYPESLAALGAKIIFFSPLHDKELPNADGYIFGGGFPEMFAEKLSENLSMLESVRQNTKPLLAECGGMMYLCRSMTDLNLKIFPMAGIIPCDSFMTQRPIIGYMEARALRNNILCGAGAIIRGHEFHYSRVVPEFHGDTCAFEFIRRNTSKSHFGGYAKKNILASYLHINFFGASELAEKFLSS